MNKLPNSNINHPSFTILGIDPGFDRVGWAIGEIIDSKFKILDFNCIQTNRKDNLTARYQQIDRELSQIIKKFRPTQLAIETVLFSVNKKTAMRVAESKGLITQICLSNNLKIFEYNPNQIKLAVTGNGRADKKSMAKMLELELKLKINKQLDDALDAIAIVYTHRLIHKS